MTIEIIAIPGLVFLAVTLSAKLIERRNDVLYGPYITGRKRARAGYGDQITEAMAALGLQQSFGRLAFKLGTVSCFASAIIG